MVLSTARDVPLAFTQMGDGEKEKQKINIMSQTIPGYTIWDTRIILWQNLGMKVTVKNVEEQALFCLFPTDHHEMLLYRTICKKVSTDTTY